MEVNSCNEVKIRFYKDSCPSDPNTQPVLIVGQLSNLNRITFDDVKHKFADRVTEDIFKSALASLHPTTSDSVSMYVNLANLASIPGKSSRHNSKARPYSLANVIKSNTSSSSETIIVVCPFDDIMASAAAIARSYPMYNRKTSGKTNRHEVRVEFILTDPDNVGGVDFKALDVLAEAVRNAARIVDTPCNEMNVSTFLDEIVEVADKHKLELTVIRGEELKQKGINGIYSVGKSATSPPALAVLTYKPQVATGPKIAWVGKGIVYDTGGLSLKTKVTMPGMKRDCAGAAGVLGAISVAAELGLTVELSAVFCLAENSVGPNSTRPDDIETLYSGRTVEINNTDAEGRLVLADGVVYASKDLGANIILDMATLTGAQGIATGKYHGAVLTNSSEWESNSLDISKIAGDLVFPIPFAPELHFSEFTSAVADMKNSVADRTNAQSSCAGLFILAHLGFDFPGVWIHVDMASPAYSGERATGYGVALLTLLFGNYSKNDMIRKLHEIAMPT